MSAPLVSVTLEVHGVEGAWIAEASFQNHGQDPAPLYRPNVFPDGAVENNIFVITIDGQPVPYKGPYVERGTPRPEDFVLVPPRGQLRYSVKLDEAYAIPVAPGQRHAVYEAFHGDMKLWGGIWKLRSNEAVF